MKTHSFAVSAVVASAAVLLLVVRWMVSFSIFPSHMLKRGITTRLIDRRQFYPSERHPWTFSFVGNWTKKSGYKTSVLQIRQFQTQLAVPYLELRLKTKVISILFDSFFCFIVLFSECSHFSLKLLNSFLLFFHRSLSRFLLIELLPSNC